MIGILASLMLSSPQQQQSFGSMAAFDPLAAIMAAADAKRAEANLLVWLVQLPLLLSRLAEP